jgi:hypothetical protein
MVSLFEILFDGIGNIRNKMHEKQSRVSGLYDPEILKLSEKLDRKLNNFQKILQLAAPEGIGQIFLSHEHLILQNQNKNMPFEYNVLKTFVNFFKITLDYVRKKSDSSSEHIDNIRHFLDSINESDESILNKFVLTYEGEILSEEEAKNFIVFVRIEIRLSVSL